MTSHIFNFELNDMIFIRVNAASTSSQIANSNIILPVKRLTGLLCSRSLLFSRIDFHALFLNRIWGNEAIDISRLSWWRQFEQNIYISALVCCFVYVGYISHLTCFPHKIYREQHNQSQYTHTITPAQQQSDHDCVLRVRKTILKTNRKKKE